MPKKAKVSIQPAAIICCVFLNVNLTSEQNFVLIATYAEGESTSWVTLEVFFYGSTLWGVVSFCILFTGKPVRVNTQESRGGFTQCKTGGGTLCP